MGNVGVKPDTLADGAINAHTDTVITASDEILFGDVTDSNNLKKDTVQGLLDLRGSGEIVQHVYANYTTKVTTTDLVPHDDTIPQTSEGVALTGLDLTITPKNASNILWYHTNLFVLYSVGAWVIQHVHIDDAADAVCVSDEFIAGASQGTSLTMDYFVAAGSTSARTYNLYCGGQNAGTFTLNSDIYAETNISSASIMEIAV